MLRLLHLWRPRSTGVSRSNSHQAKIQEMGLLTRIGAMVFVCNQGAVQINYSIMVGKVSSSSTQMHCLIATAQTTLVNILQGKEGGREGNKTHTHSLSSSSSVPSYLLPAALHTGRARVRSRVSSLFHFCPSSAPFIRQSLIRHHLFLLQVDTS